MSTTGYLETPTGLARDERATAPGGESGCGGLTGVTPLELYRSRIGEQAKKTGSATAPAN